jgi:hypothetical protein
MVCTLEEPRELRHPLTIDLVNTVAVVAKGSIAGEASVEARPFFSSCSLSGGPSCKKMISRRRS